MGTACKHRVHDRFTSLYCILPPHILENIRRNGQPDQQAWAHAALLQTALLRGQREAFSLTAAAVPADGRRTIYDAKAGMQLPGGIVRTEGGPPTNRADVDEAYDGAGATRDFYREAFSRDSVDGKGMRLDSSINYGKQYDNAFWNGRQMVYGEGDGKLFNRFTISIDVIGHELTHGVTQFTAALEYQGQSGALNESMSDVFGSMIKQFANKQTVDKADWLIGAGLLTKAVNGTALRSMANPGTAYDDKVLGKDPQPADMQHYLNTDQDNGGVHINSGIPNKAFHDAAMAIGGFAWEVTGKIWYEALTTRLQPTADFAAAARATIDVAQRYGADAVTKVTAAWKNVGVI
jgi:Zn-dependent metalloprotease